MTEPEDDDSIPAPPLPKSQFEEFVRENPIGAIIGAVIVGILLGKLVL
jgi:hypothetical protein